MPDIPLLNPVVLNGVVEKFTIPENLLGRSSLMGGDRIMPNPDPTVYYDIIQGNRERAGLNVPNAEAHIIKQLGIGSLTASMMYLREKKVFTPTTIRWLRNPGTLNEKNATRAVLREIQDLNNRFEKFAEFTIWTAFTTGVIQLTSNNVSVDLDYQFPVTHKPNAVADWQTAGTDIIGDVFAWKRLITRDSQAVPTTVYLNEVLMQAVTNNSDIRSLLSDQKKDELLNTSTLKGLLGMTWVVYDLAFVDDNGVVTNYIGDTQLVMISNDNPDRWFFYEGPSADDDAPEGHIGKFVKTWKEKDPSARQFLQEWHFLPGILRPDQIVAATTVP